MALTLTTTLVLLDSGEIDEQGSALAFEAELANYKAARETEEATIAAVIHGIFDKYKGASISMPALAGTALRELNVVPANHKVMEEKVLAYVRENSDRAEKKNRKTGAIEQVAEPKRTRTFGIKKGVGGGVCRWEDVPEKDEE